MMNVSDYLAIERSLFRAYEAFRKLPVRMDQRDKMYLLWREARRDWLEARENEREKKQTK